MRDGVKLFTSIYIPKDTTEKHPFLLTRTPIPVLLMGRELQAVSGTAIKDYYLRENYIIVTRMCAARFMSEGEFDRYPPFNPNKKTNHEIDEASDTYDAIDWLVKNIPEIMKRLVYSGSHTPASIPPWLH